MYLRVCVCVNLVHDKVNFYFAKFDYLIFNALYVKYSKPVVF